MFVSFIKFGKFSTIISSNISCAPFSSSETPTMHMLVLLMVLSQVLYALFTCFKFFLCPLRFNSLHCFIFMFADSFFGLLKPAFEYFSLFFILVIVLSAPAFLFVFSLLISDIYILFTSNFLDFLLIFLKILEYL